MAVVGDIAFKYLRFFSTSKSLKTMTIISIVGIAIGVFTLLVTLGVAGGFGEAYRKSITDFSAHVVLFSSKEIPEYQTAVDRLEDFKALKGDSESWEKRRWFFSLIKQLERLWIRIDMLNMELISKYGEKSNITRLMKAIHPASGAAILYKTGLYPRWLVEEIKKTIEMSERGVVSINPFIYREGLLVHDGKIRGIVVKGVSGEPKTPGVKDLPARIASEWARVAGRPRVKFGKYLAKESGVKPGDVVRIMLPHKWGGKDSYSFEEVFVDDLFESGMYDYDSQFILLDIDKAQEVFGAQGLATGIEIKLDDWRKAPNFALRLNSELRYPLYATSWQDLNRSLFEAVKLEKLMFAIIMGSLVVVAAFNIVGTVMLRILYKTSDISILRALGLDVVRIKKIFVLQGVIIGAIGTFLGVFLALLVIWAANRFDLIKIPAEIYLIERLPVCISSLAVVMVSTFSILICYLTSVTASRKILELPLLKGLHRT